MTPISESGQGGKSLCCGCGLTIEDRYLLRVMGNSWHERCLQCDFCRAPLTRSCFVKNGRLLCKLDYDRLYAARCSACVQTVPSNELVMRAVGHVFHLQCFVCVACGHQLQRGDQFVVKDGQLFCRADFEREFLMQHPDWCSGYSTKSDEESSIDENDADNQKGPKRPRTILTTSQRRKFKASFEVNPKPCRKIRESLASETGLSVRVVQVWFQNQRAKMKKLARKQSGDKSGEENKKNAANKKEKKKQVNDPDEEKLTKSEEMDLKITGSTDKSQNSASDFHSGEFTDLHSNSSDMFQNQVDAYAEMNGGGFPSYGTATLSRDHSDVMAVPSSVLNPIDKLFSMQDSYFTAS
ncbi:hypothetical protein CAPTEDRAFT_167213 [Capitella teleta]|uniref:Uncharacterized protein n=1 Tax=Capitella teleta TaxID=283909 RepID=R7TPZ8_CAPTE|nr:hypothetical protein CAPTEDRAFT_167213 [Capitella teleta]|eukprot:ELT95963.1 hypothetical protein CAPTEDRAFT_167213 [Capitella teleta]